MKDKSGIFLFCSLSILIAVIPFVCGIYYATPDDPRYIALVSGAYTGMPMKELVYVCSILGAFEAWLYSVCPKLEWYSVIYYMLTLCCFSTLLWHILSSKFDKLLKAMFVFLALAMQVYLSLTPQFTTLATQLAFVSLVTIINAKGRKAGVFWGVCLFFLSTQLRFVAAFIPYMVACPIFLRNVDIKNRLWWRENYWVIPILFVAAVTFCAEKYTYRSEEWSKFQTTNDARGYVSDNPIVLDYSKNIANEEDKLAFELWYRYRIFDLNILTPSKIHEYQQIFKAKMMKTIRHNRSPYMRMYSEMGLWVVMVLILYLFYEFVRNRQWKPLTLLAITLVMFLLANVTMMSFSFPKERVMFGTAVSLVFAILYFVSHYSRNSRVIMICIVSFFLLQYVRKGYDELRESLRDRPIIAETEKMILSSKADKVFLTVPVCLTPEAFNTSRSPIYTHSIIQGWLHFYPAADLRHQPFISLVDGIPLLVDKTSTEQIDMICSLIKMHYGIDVAYRILNESKHYYLYKLEKKII